MVFEKVLSRLSLGHSCQHVAVRLVYRGPRAACFPTSSSVRLLLLRSTSLIGAYAHRDSGAITDFDETWKPLWMAVKNISYGAGKPWVESQTP
jgi:hypothetical protein